jgi:hypothetical protein
MNYKPIRRRSNLYFNFIFIEVISSSPLDINYDINVTNVNNILNVDKVLMLSQKSLHKTQKVRKSTITDDYIVYLIEEGCDLGHADDSISFKQTIMNRNSSQWLKAMNDEIKSMKFNELWDLIELLIRVKPIRCIWVYKTKTDSEGNIKRYKV